MILERIDGPFSRVLPLWCDFPVVLLGGGPSLTPAQFDLVRAARASDAVRVIAINDAYLLAPWADVHYAADSKWHTWHGVGIPKPKLGLSAPAVRERWAAFPGQKCGLETAQPYLPDDVHMLRVAPWSHERGLSRDPGTLATGRHDGYTGHSGFQALNLATLAGAKDIILLGYDAREGHFHGGHPIPTPADVWDHIRRSFSCIERELNDDGVRVLNCSPGTSIDTFPKPNLDDALSDLRITA